MRSTSVCQTALHHYEWDALLLSFLPFYLSAGDCDSCVYKEMLNAFAASLKSVSSASNDVFLINGVKSSGKQTHCAAVVFSVCWILAEDHWSCTLVFTSLSSSQVSDIQTSSVTAVRSTASWECAGSVRCVSTTTCALSVTWTTSTTWCTPSSATRRRIRTRESSVCSLHDSVPASLV